jgi:CheY-like chemotaxis protein
MSDESDSVRYLTKPVTEADLIACIAAACPSAESFRILYADDAEEMRGLVHAFLGDAHHIDWAAHGQAAIEKFKTGRYHVVVTDMQMPVMDGHALIAAMRAWERESKLPATPVVVLSGDPYPGADTPRRITATPDEDILALVPAFLEARREDVHLLARALSLADYPLMETIGHRMKGMGRSYGFAGVSEIGRALELAARACRLDEAEHAVDALREYLACVEVPSA